MAGVVAQYRRAGLFYAVATAVPWTGWGLAGWLSHREPQTHDLVAAESLLGLAGLMGPMVVAFFLIGADRELRGDFLGRVLNFRDGSLRVWVAAFFLMPASILAAMAISLLFGYSPDQFQLAAHPSFTSGILPVWFLLLLAPTLEELGWHSYGTDALRARFTLFSASLLFAVYWALWHAPLALIKGYYQSNLVQQGAWDAINFPLSIIPFVLIMNWLYYRSGRNILIAIVFHITSGYFNELFQTHPDSKIFQTGLLLVVAAVLLMTDRKLFFRRSLEAA